MYIKFVVGQVKAVKHFAILGNMLKQVAITTCHLNTETVSTLLRASSVRHLTPFSQKMFNVTNKEQQLKTQSSVYSPFLCVSLCSQTEIILFAVNKQAHNTKM